MYVTPEYNFTMTGLPMTCFRKSVGFFFARGGATALLVSALDGTEAPVAFVLLMNSINLSDNDWSTYDSRTCLSSIRASFVQ